VCKTQLDAERYNDWSQLDVMLQHVDIDTQRPSHWTRSHHLPDRQV